MYYVDCSCENHNAFREYDNFQSAKSNFDTRDCKEKILYEDGENGFKTIEEKK